MKVGDRMPDRRFVVSGPAMKVFSVLMHDPNPVHFDPEFVRSLGLGDKPVNQGSITMSYPITAVLEWIGDPERLVTFRCRFLKTLLADEVAIAGGEVTAVDGERATVAIWLDSEGGDRVIEGSATVALPPPA